MKKKFTYIEETHFNNCEDCPFYLYIDDDDIECTKLRQYICVYYDERIDNRNNQGVLDNCPFLKTNTITNNEQDN